MLNLQYAWMCNSHAAYCSQFRESSCVTHEDRKHICFILRLHEKKLKWEFWNNLNWKSQFSGTVCVPVLLQYYSTLTELILKKNYFFDCSWNTVPVNSWVERITLCANSGLQFPCFPLTISRSKTLMTSTWTYCLHTQWWRWFEHISSIFYTS